MKQQSFESTNTFKNLERYKQADFQKKQREALLKTLKWLERFAGQKINDNAKFLEIGLGSGETICYIAERWQAAGLEPSSAFFDHVKKKANERGLQLDLRQGSAETIPFPFSGQKFDIIIMQSVLEHVRDYKTALSNVFHSLRSGGIFVFNTTNKFRIIPSEYNFPPFCYSYLPDTWRFAIRRWRQGRDIMEHGIDYHQFIPWKLKRELKIVGFRRISDSLEVLKESDVNQGRHNLVRVVKNIPILTALYRLFYADTFFFCEK